MGNAKKVDKTFSTPKDPEIEKLIERLTGWETAQGLKNRKETCCSLIDIMGLATQTISRLDGSGDYPEIVYWQRLILEHVKTILRRIDSP